MRVFLDTKSNRLRVELAQGAVARTYSSAPGPDDKPKDEPPPPVFELDVAKGGEVLEVRVQGLDELMAALGLRPAVATTA